jgi:hypothetical protein
VHELLSLGLSSAKQVAYLVLINFSLMLMDVFFMKIVTSIMRYRQLYSCKAYLSKVDDNILCIDV